MTEEINQTSSEENNNQPIETEEIKTVETTTPEVAAHEPVISIGDLLRSKREAKGLNLKTISHQTKIHIGLLEHLENNDLAKLPSKTYVRGFVKAEAKILGINQEEALSILEATYNRDNKAVKKENKEIQNESVRNTLSTIAATPLETVRGVTISGGAFLAKLTVGILIIGIIGFNVKNLIDHSAEERLKLPQVLSTIQQKIKSPPKASTSKVIPKSVEAELAAPTPIAVNIIQDKKDLNQKSEIVIDDISLKNISLGEKQFTFDTSVSPEKLDEYLPAKYRVQVTKGIENVFINAIDGDSWITYKVDDKDIKKFVLRQGRTIFLRGANIRLFVGNTSTIKIFYNNKLINVNTKTGVKNMVFPEEMKTKFMNPLFVFQKDGTVVTSEDFIKANQKPGPEAGTPPAPNGLTTPAPVKTSPQPLTKPALPVSPTPAPVPLAPSTPVKRL